MIMYLPLFIKEKRFTSSYSNRNVYTKTINTVFHKLQTFNFGIQYRASTYLNKLVPPFNILYRAKFLCVEKSIFLGCNMK